MANKIIKRGTGKSAAIDPVSRMPSVLDTQYALVDFLAGAPAVLSREEIGYMDHDRPNRSSHPNKSNPGGPVRYY